MALAMRSWSRALPSSGPTEKAFAISVNGAPCPAR